LLPGYYTACYKTIIPDLKKGIAEYLQLAVNPFPNQQVPALCHNLAAGECKGKRSILNN
jgi:hypothetical protein